MTQPEEATIVALREAARALAIGEQAGPATIADAPHSADVALAAAQMLEAAAHLLRSTDVDTVPRDSTQHGLHAVVQHLSAGAELARRYTRTDDDGATQPLHPEAGIDADQINQTQ